MGRTSRVPYHQNVYDLLGIEPGVCPDAARMIAEHEAVHGPLPASFREWCLLPGAVPQRWRAWTPSEVYLDCATDLEEILRQFAFAQRDAVYFVDSDFESCNNLILDGSDDPPVGWRNHPAEWSTFSSFIAWYFGLIQDPLDNLLANYSRPHENGLWLRSPAEPFAPPIIDFLTEQFGEPERTPREGDVTTYTWRPDGGTIRVTADHPAHPEPLSAWWVHAAAPEQLAEFARLLRPWGTLAQTLRADTEPARAVWDSGRAGV